MILHILTPDEQVFKGAIKSVKVPGVKGQFEVLSGHAPIVSSLGQGVVRVITSGGQVKRFEIPEGFIEVLFDNISVLVPSLDEIEA